VRCPLCSFRMRLEVEFRGKEAMLTYSCMSCGFIVRIHKGAEAKPKVDTGWRKRVVRRG